MLNSIYRKCHRWHIEPGKAIFESNESHTGLLDVCIVYFNWPWYSNVYFGSEKTISRTPEIEISDVFTHVRSFFLTYRRIQDRVIPMLARCRKNLSHIATHVR